MRRWWWCRRTATSAPAASSCARTARPTCATSSKRSRRGSGDRRGVRQGAPAVRRGAGDEDAQPEPRDRRPPRPARASPRPRLRRRRRRGDLPRQREPRADPVRRAAARHRGVDPRARARGRGHAHVQPMARRLLLVRAGTSRRGRAAPAVGHRRRDRGGGMGGVGGPPQREPACRVGAGLGPRLPR